MKKALILIALFVALVLVGVYVRNMGRTQALETECQRAGGTFDDATVTCTLPPIGTATTTDPDDDDDTGVATTTPDGDDVSDMIRVDEPDANEVVSSPLVVTGEARGGWYFEASFPVRLRVGTATIAVAPAQAQGEWMTSDFVPFEVTLTFPAQPAGTTGTLILENDNPSGLPENSRKIEIPVRF